MKALLELVKLITIFISVFTVIIGGGLGFFSLLGYLIR